MDVRNLRQILAIQQYGSFAKAADALGMAQPSLSKSIARLEDQLKVRIFDRTASGSALTPIGELIVQRAERVLAETRDLVRDAALVAGGEAGLVRMGVSTTLRENVLPRLVVKIAQRHPRLNLEVELNGAHRLLPRLETRELDIVLCAEPIDGPDVALVYLEVFRAECAIVASPGHPLAQRRGLTVKDLSEWRCAGTLVKGFRNAEILGFDHENFAAYAANDYDALLPLVCAGHAILPAPVYIVAPLVSAGRLVRLDVDWRREVGFGSLTTQAVSISPVLGKIARYAVEIGAELQEEWTRGRRD